MPHQGGDLLTQADGRAADVGIDYRLHRVSAMNRVHNCHVTDGDTRRRRGFSRGQIAAAHGYAVLLRSGFLSGHRASIDDIAENAAQIARNLAETASRTDP
jgi:hypothetical protein